MGTAKSLNAPLSIEASSDLSGGYAGRSVTAACQDFDESEAS